MSARSGRCATERFWLTSDGSRMTMLAGPPVSVGWTWMIFGPSTSVCGSGCADAGASGAVAVSVVSVGSADWAGGVGTGRFRSRKAIAVEPPTTATTTANATIRPYPNRLAGGVSRRRADCPSGRSISLPNSFKLQPLPPVSPASGHSAGSANSRQPGPGSSQPELHASLVENCLLRVGRESRVGLLPAQQLQRKGQLQVVLRVRRHIGSGAGTLLALLGAL